MSDILIFAHDRVCPTSTGNVDFTDSRFSGSTPKAVMIIATNQVPANDPNPTASRAKMSIGFCDGTRQRALATRANAGANVLCRREMRDDATFLSQHDSNGTTFDYVASFVSFIADGVRLNFTTTLGSSARRIIVILFGGADLTAYCATQNLGTGTSAIDITAPGFEPDVVFGMTPCVGLNTNDGNYCVSFGVAVNDGTPTQKGMAHNVVNINGEEATQVIWTNRIGGQTSGANNNTINYHLTISAFDGSGFSVTPNASAGSDDWCFLALAFGSGHDFALFDFSTRTSTGVQSITTPGFEPGFVLTLGTWLTSRDTSIFGAAGVQGTVMLGAMDANEQHAAVTYVEPQDDGGGTFAEANLQPLGLLISDPNDVVADITADFDGLTGSGFDLDYTAANGTARMCWALAIAGPDAAPSGGSRRATQLML